MSGRHPPTKCMGTVRPESDFEINDIEGEHAESGNNDGERMEAEEETAGGAKLMKSPATPT